MKKQIYIVMAFAMMFIVLACGSHELTHSHAKAIINACLQNKPDAKHVVITLKKAQFHHTDKDEIPNYQQLAKDGYITLKELSVKGKKNQSALEEWVNNAQYFDITMTDKSQPFIVDRSEKRNAVKIITYSYVVDEVLEIHENPSQNTAKVKVRFKLGDKTPFSILYKGRVKDSKTETLTFKKTNQGWQYCANH